MAKVLRIDKALVEQVEVLIESGQCYTEQGKLYFHEELVAYVTTDGEGMVESTKIKITGNDTMKDTAVEIYEKNKEAVIDSAKMEAGRIALNQIMKAYVKLPWGFGKLKKSPLVRLAVANIVSFAVTKISKSPIAIESASYVVKSAMLDAVSSLDLINKFEDILESNIAKMFK